MLYSNNQNGASSVEQETISTEDFILRWATTKDPRDQGDGFYFVDTPT